MSNTYRLVNPTIDGEMKTSLKMNNSMLAGKAFYKNLSQHFNNHIPEYYFSIQKGNSHTGKYYHFKVTEKKNGNEVKFNIEPYVITNTEKISNFESKLNNFKSKQAQIGGKKPTKKSSKKKRKTHKKKYDSDSSDSDSSEDFYVKAQSYKPDIVPPVYYYWYDTGLYDLDYYYAPTWYSYTTPFMYYPLY